MTDVNDLTSIATLYQAVNEIYNLFDKILVLDQGSQIYFSLRGQARGFTEDLGFIRQDGANVADFLADVTVPTEREIRPSFEAIFPRTADAIRERYEQGLIHA